jgi:hypothetical protein
MTQPGRTVLDAIELQRAAAEALGSPLLARLLDAVQTDVGEGGPCRALLEGASERPVHDAVPLRLLGALHRLVLEGRAPVLARWYPSAGGDAWAPGDLDAEVRATVAEHERDVAAAMGRTVQTNEVGRAAVLAGGFAEVARRTGLPLRLREVGASAGLLLRWDHYAYDTGRGPVVGPTASPLCFEPGWWQGDPPDLAGVVVAERRGCDIAPIDPTTTEGSLTLQSFVWPDQLERLERLRAAIAVAHEVPAVVDAADGGSWARAQLAEVAPGLATVLYHSIVWQYLPPDSRAALRAALEAAGSAATEDAPVAWLRMEPAGDVADLRLTLWPGGTTEVLATSGYHGRPVRWGVLEA